MAVRGSRGGCSSTSAHHHSYVVGGTGRGACGRGGTPNESESIH
ncbi:hypothetical protein SXIM_09730 [Streptomyces xiamenensis]|uniref:Uncharacterized protein n=1 Tax=Streptomyces xiamenensis TaxID=408015 RepID=A0A0F7FS45_9ACTN|nr:hypothetical protein SXIM_09730 [Streptomyces xiamenensis]